MVHAFKWSKNVVVKSGETAISQSWSIYVKI